MDQTPPQTYQQLMCSKHQQQQSDLIHLTGTSNQGRICFLCCSRNNIPYQEILHLSEVFEKKEEIILSTFPPFENTELREEIKRYHDLKTSKESIDSFFSKLRGDIEKKISDAEKKAKQQFIEHEQQIEDLINEMKKISQVGKLKEYLLSNDTNKLNEFLKEKWANQKQNQMMISNLLKDAKLKIKESNLNEIQDKISQNLNQLFDFNLFQVSKQIIKDINLVKSTYATSGNLTINKLGDGELQWLNKNNTNENGQAYLDFILNPKKCYIIRLHYQPFKGVSSFAFGLTSDSIKDQSWSYEQNMIYFNYNSEYGISKYLKGPNITSGQRINQKEEFEVRICLQNKMLQVASLPDYETVIELDNPNKIKADTSYRFFLGIQYPGDLLQINDCYENNYPHPFL